MIKTKMPMDKKRKEQTFRTKRRRTELENQLTGGINAPPKIVSLVEPFEGCLCFLVPSTDKSKDDITYKVTIATKNNELKYLCTCTNTIDNFGACKHIRAVIIFLSIDLIKTQSDTDDNLGLIEALNNFRINDEKKMDLEEVVKIDSSKENSKDIIKVPESISTPNCPECFSHSTYPGYIFNTTFPTK